MPSVSVVVPVHNGEQHLRHSLGSICRQTLTDIEIIVIDDGSTDTTPDIIGEFAASDPRIRTAAGPAIGSAGAARNVGLELARGDYLAFLDADDFFSPDLLARLQMKATSERADLVATRFRVFDELGGEPVTVEWGLRTEFLPVRTPFAPGEMGGALFYAFGPVAWNKLFRSDFIREHGLRFQPLRRTNDLFFTFSALAHARRISYVDRTLIDYRTGNPGSLQGSTHRAPLEFADALGALQAELRESGLYDGLEAAFVNEAVEVCLANLARVSSYAAFRQVDDALRTDLLERFGARHRSPDYFVTRGLAERLSSYLGSTSEEYLFGQVRQMSDQAARARADARTALYGVAGQPVTVISDHQAQPVPGTQDVAPGAEIRDGVDVSVVVPVHNTAPWLDDCFEGIRRQTGVSLEVICVDDGSTDSSPDVLRRAAESDARIRVVRQENAGLSAARNTGMAQASGRYLCFLDSDDYWAADALAELVRAADAGAADLLLFDAVTLAEPGVDEKTRAIYHRDYYRRSQAYPDGVSGQELMARMKAAGDYRVQACLYLLRTDYVREHFLRFRPGLPREDNLFTFEALLRARRAAHRPVALYTRRLRAGSLITAGSRAAAARGYFVTFYEMLRITAPMTFDDATGREVGATMFKAFKQAREHFVRLDPDLGDQLAEIDPQPDAQAVFLILRQAREDARRARRGSHRPREAGGHAAGPGLLGRARRLAERGYRAASRLVGRT